MYIYIYIYMYIHSIPRRKRRHPRIIKINVIHLYKHLSNKKDRQAPVALVIEVFGHGV